MITIKEFIFNPFEEKTYLLFDETKECVIVDPGCYSEKEKKELSKFIDDHKLRPVHLLNTHCHLDHIFGNSYISKTYLLTPKIHRDELEILKMQLSTCKMYGIPNVEESPIPTDFISESTTIKFGNSSLRIIHVPGHAPGHVVFVCEESETIICGDVLFARSIGRSDLPGGNHELLITGIKSKVLTLGDNYKVYPGHGENTTIFFEKNNNPFLQQ